MFTVAKSTGHDILADIWNALLKALEEGETFESFSRQIRPALVRKGWWAEAAHRRQAPAADGRARPSLPGRDDLGSVCRVKDLFAKSPANGFQRQCKCPLIAPRWKRALTNMCGRFTQVRPWREIVRLYRLTPDQLERNTAARYNIAPTQDVPFIHLGKDGAQSATEGRWWLVPHWAKELQNKYPMFNARSEDAEKKPAYRDAYKSRRCLVPADGWNEWTKGEDGGKDPWYIHLPDRAPFSFAGLWAHNSTLDVVSFTILTAPAVSPIDKVHARMPIVLEEDQYDAWLDPAMLVLDAKGLLQHNRGAEFEFYRVGRAVNSSRTGNDPSLIEPVAE